MNKLDELKNFIDTMQGDYEKFFVKGKNAAGTRLRKSLQELRRMAQELRNEIQKVRMERKSQKSGGETPTEQTESGENN
ncbi:MAG: histone H1 [Ignavibacteria bacterium]|jgi:hypothetical protein|nr:histone H1 [Ignavibacteria bacterium]